MGASFRFGVRGEDWKAPARATPSNPNKLPERTITDVDLYEFGPVTFPAYASASAGMRSTTDEWIERLLHDPYFVARMTETYGARIVARMIPPMSADGDLAEPTVLVEPADGGTHPSIIRARIAAFLL
jgi:hypothetical protein